MPSFIVPWFSRHEWLEVYEGTFSNDIEKWKEARDSILVWQARVSKLPIGLDLTLPLLQARIADSDPQMDSVVKSIILGTALQRFVSNVVKLPKTMYYQNQTLHKLATDIGLPGHLVDLRNEIIHGSQSGWAGGCTITGALDTAFKWVKNYYWLQQLEQMNTKEDRMIDSSKSVPQRKFLIHLKEYVKISIEMQAESEINKILQFALSRFENAYSADPQECIENIVEHLLASPTLQKNLGKDLECGCPSIFSNLELMKNFESILIPILETEGVTTLLLVILIKMAQEHKGIHMKWVKLIIRSLLDITVIKGTEKLCNVHFIGIEKKNMVVDWKKVVLHLLYVDEDWASHLVISVINSSETSFPKEKVDKIMNLVKVQFSSGEKGNSTSEDEMNLDKVQSSSGEKGNSTSEDEMNVGKVQSSSGEKGNSTSEDEMNLGKVQSSSGEKGKSTSEDETNLGKVQSSSGEKGNSISEDDVFDVQSVLDHVKNHKPVSERVEAQKIVSSLSPSKSSTLIPLGVLPHQMKNKSFYKELILHYPSKNVVEPSKKRMEPSKKRIEPSKKRIEPSGKRMKT